MRPHPSDKTRRRSQCVLLDHGLSYELSPAERRHAARIWTAAATHDTLGLQSVMRELGMDPTAYDVLGSMFLQFPYEAFHPYRQTATLDEINQYRDGFNDPRIMNLLKQFSTPLLFVLGTLSLHRDVHKAMGAPVSRAARFLRYSVPLSGTNGSWLGLCWAVAKQWLVERLNWICLRAAVWWDPSLKDVVTDELLQLA